MTRAGISVWIRSTRQYGHPSPGKLANLGDRRQIAVDDHLVLHAGGQHVGDELPRVNVLAIANGNIATAGRSCVAPCTEMSALQGTLRIARASPTSQAMLRPDPDSEARARL